VNIALINQEICVPTGAAIAVPSAVAVHAAFLPDGTVQSQVGTIAAQPGTLINMGFALKVSVTDADASITSTTVHAVGTDWFGRDVDEVWSSNVAGSANYDMAKIFTVLTTLDVTGVDYTGADLLSIGVSNIVGIPYVIATADDVVNFREDAVIEAAPTIVVANNSIVLPTSPDGAARYYADLDISF